MGGVPFIIMFLIEKLESKCRQWCKYSAGQTASVERESEVINLKLTLYLYIDVAWPM